MGLGGGAVAEAAVESFPVVKDFDVIGDGEAGAGPGGERFSVVNLVFSEAKNDSAAALSQHTPVRPTLVRTRLSLQNRENSAEVYWVDSTGRCNTSMMEVWNGATTRLGSGCDGTTCDAVAGSAAGSAAGAPGSAGTMPSSSRFSGH